MGQPRMTLVGALLMALAFAIVGNTPVPWPAFPAILLFGLGYYLMHNTLQTLATQMAPDARGSAVALFATFFFLSQAAGVLAAGLSIDRFGATAVFAAAAIMLIAIGVMAFVSLKRASATS